MDGVMVAYHNTARIFGFQYIPLEEMDERLYGNKHAGPLIFSRCVELLQIINDEITHHFPEQVSPLGSKIRMRGLTSVFRVYAVCGTQSLRRVPLRSGLSHTTGQAWVVHRL